MNNHVKYYKAAEITIQIKSDYPISEKTFHTKFKLFEVNGPGEENITIHHHFHLPAFLTDQTVYNNKIYHNEFWKVFKTDNSWIYKYNPFPIVKTGFPVIGIFNNNHTVIDIYAPDIDAVKYEKGNFNALTLFNSDQILFSKLLCNKKGLILHSNGFDIFGNGILLTGESGAGKSTLSKMLKNKGFQILCDDRMFIKQKEDFCLYGNWCHGTVPDVSSTNVPLKAIFFLEKSKHNLIQQIDDKNEIFLKLITSVVRPFLDRNEWNSTLKTLEEIINATKVYKLQFDLSGKICNIISKLF